MFNVKLIVIHENYTKTKRSSTKPFKYQTGDPQTKLQIQVPNFQAFN